MSHQPETTARVRDLPPALNLGCGTDHRDCAVNVDISAAVDPDVVCDLDDRPWPLPSDHFHRAIAEHVFEHLREPIAALDELCRVLKPGAVVTLAYPIGHTRFEDPTHRQFWNYNTAAAIAGERKHSHEHIEALSLVDRRVEWSVSGRLWRTYTRVRLMLHGPGPWLSQIPGLSGEVTATYRYQP